MPEPPELVATGGAERFADGALELGDEPAGAGALPPVFGTPVTDGADGADGSLGADGRLGAGAGAGAGAGTLGVGAGAGAWT